MHTQNADSASISSEEIFTADDIAKWIPASISPRLRKRDDDSSDDGLESIGF